MSSSESVSETIQTPRRTVQREAVLDALHRSGAFISAQGLYDAMSNGPVPVSLATVYRHLNAFVDTGLADTISRQGHQLFRACVRTSSHSHVTCDVCGRDGELDLPLSSLAREARSLGFEIKHVTVEVLGRCRQCEQAAPH